MTDNDEHGQAPASPVIRQRHRPGYPGLLEKVLTAEVVPPTPSPTPRTRDRSFLKTLEAAKVLPLGSTETPVFRTRPKPKTGLGHTISRDGFNANGGVDLPPTEDELERMKPLPPGAIQIHVGCTENPYTGLPLTGEEIGRRWVEGPKFARPTDRPIPAQWPNGSKCTRYDKGKSVDIGRVFRDGMEWHAYMKATSGYRYIGVFKSQLDALNAL